jgi:ADP-heptose:LPS heptosyltransferase
LKRILVIQTAYLGDVVLATALLEALHHQFPPASIDILVRKGAEGLLKGHPFLGTVLVFDKNKGRYKQLYILLKKIRNTRYDLVVNCHRFASSGFLAAFSGAGIVSGFLKNPFSRFFHHRYEHQISNGMHEIQRNHKLISFLGVEGHFLPKLYPPEPQGNNGEPYICIAPASVWFTKQWPAHKWVELIREIPDNYVVYLLGSKTDWTLCEKIKEQTGRTNVVNYCGKFDLLQSAAFMRNAQMNYVNDSAPLHLCSAVNAPVTAIFCSTVPGFGFGPLSDRAHLVETSEALSCRPCGLHGYKACPEGHFKCAERIAVEKVV